MTRVILKQDLSPKQAEELAACGPDAQNHPLEMADGRLRFKANAAICYMHRTRQIQLGNLTGLDMAIEDHRLGLREFYRHLGYSLSSYAALFGGMLEEEEEVRALNEK